MTQKLSDFLRAAVPWGIGLQSQLSRIIQNQGLIMGQFEDLKASQDAIVVLVGKVKVDVELLHAQIAAFPPAGMTPEQTAALSAALAQAEAIRASLAGVDALTDEAVVVPTPTPDA